MPKLAETIKVISTPGKGNVLIDGEEFPWYIAEGGVKIIDAKYDERGHITDLPRVRIEILAVKDVVEDAGGIIRTTGQSLAAKS